jgi:hypothetical protein
MKPLDGRLLFKQEGSWHDVCHAWCDDKNTGIFYCSEVTGEFGLFRLLSFSELNLRGCAGDGRCIVLG